MKSSTALPSNGKLYVFGGWDDGKARGVNYEYDPATDKWTKKTPMPRPAHHAALAAANGKIYVMGGFVPPKDTAIPAGRRMGTHRQRVGVRPGGGFLEVAAAAARQARVRGRRGSRRQDLRDRRRHDGGRVQGPVLHVLRTVSGSRHQRGVRPCHEQVGEPPADVRAAQPRVQRRRQRQDLRHRRPDRARLHPVRHQHRCGGGVQPHQRLVERSEGTDAHRSKRRSVGLGRPQDLRRRRRGDDQGSRRCVSQRRGVRPVDEFVDDAALHADAASRHRGRGDRQSLSPGERDDAVGRSADVPRPDTLNAHGAARHSGAAVRCAAANSCCQERGRGAFAGSGNGCERNGGPFPAVDDGCKDRGGSAFPGSRRRSTRATTSTARKAR